MSDIMKDPLAIAREAELEKSRMKSNYVGVFCPQRNKHLFGNTKCKACDSIKHLWNAPENSPQRKIAIDKSAKMNFWFCVTTKANPDRWIVLEVGKNVGNEILDGISKKNWIDLLYPDKDKGREISITKTQSGGFNKYSASPSLEKASWPIPEGTMIAAPNMDELVSLVSENKLKDGENFMKVSSLKNDETFTFRILPPKAASSVFKLGIAWGYRHFGGITQDQIDGIEPVDLTIQDVQQKTAGAPTGLPWETTKQTTTTTTTEQKSGCFGDVRYFDDKDPECSNCKTFKACGREILSKKPDEIPY